MYSQFKQREPHPLEKYVGRHVIYQGRTREVVGYATWSDGSCSPIADASKDGGWKYPIGSCVIFKKCEGYLYVNINDLID